MPLRRTEEPTDGRLERVCPADPHADAEAASDAAAQADKPYSGQHAAQQQGPPGGGQVAPRSEEVTWPEAVTVGPYRYRIVCTQAEMDRARVVAGDTSGDRVGETDHHSLVIRLDPAIAIGMRREALLHEVLHAVAGAAGWNEGKRTSERAIQALSPGLLDTLRRNPLLVSALLSSHDGEEHDANHQD